MANIKLIIATMMPLKMARISLPCKLFERKMPKMFKINVEKIKYLPKIFLATEFEAVTTDFTVVLEKNWEVF